MAFARRSQAHGGAVIHRSLREAERILLSTHVAPALPIFAIGRSFDDAAQTSAEANMTMVKSAHVIT